MHLTTSASLAQAQVTRRIQITHSREWPAPASTGEGELSWLLRTHLQWAQCTLARCTLSASELLVGVAARLPRRLPEAIGKLDKQLLRLVSPRLLLPARRHRCRLPPNSPLHSAGCGHDGGPRLALALQPATAPHACCHRLLIILPTGTAPLLLCILSPFCEHSW